MKLIVQPDAKDAAANSAVLCLDLVQIATFYEPHKFVPFGV